MQKAIEHFTSFGFVGIDEGKYLKDNVIVEIDEHEITVSGAMVINAPLCIVEQQPLFVNHIWNLVYSADEMKLPEPEPETKAKRTRRKGSNNA